MPRCVRDGASGKEGRGHTGGDDVVRDETRTTKEDEKECESASSASVQTYPSLARYKVNRPPAPVQWY